MTVNLTVEMTLPNTPIYMIETFWRDIWCRRVSLDVAYGWVSGGDPTEGPIGGPSVYCIEFFYPRPATRVTKATTRVDSYWDRAKSLTSRRIKSSNTPDNISLMLVYNYSLEPWVILENVSLVTAFDV